MRSIRLMAILFGLFISSSLVQAETLLINSSQASASVDKPAAGMSMDKVLNRYGEPTTRAAAIGQPPITQWAYSGYTVYFEHQHVIHAVVIR